MYVYNHKLKYVEFEVVPESSNEEIFFLASFGWTYLEISSQTEHSRDLFSTGWPQNNYTFLHSTNMYEYYGGVILGIFEEMRCYSVVYPK